MNTPKNPLDTMPSSLIKDKAMSAINGQFGLNTHREGLVFKNVNSNFKSIPNPYSSN